MHTPKWSGFSRSAIDVLLSFFMGYTTRKGKMPKWTYFFPENLTDLDRFFEVCLAYWNGCDVRFAKGVEM